ncbi:MAG TPA: PTS mannitol transporter subunit IICB, partial [Atopostipes sp.]|nr:PTS mannitol transporter subunit IICB [Atopostipes sp.]
FQGGKLVYEERGGVAGAIAVMGVIVGSPIPMFIGAMIMGPLAGWLIKQLDNVFASKIRTGFEMLYNNFSAGILGTILAIIGFYAIGPAVTAGTEVMAAGVDSIIQLGLLPLANIFIEPAKVLFLNNAINHGILTPLGTEQALETGKSILYLLEANPGPGLGILVAFALFGKGSAKSSSWGAMVIHFFGGIHEIYFPYVMMKPSLFFAVIGGGVTGTFVNQLLDVGLTAPASPGSIIAVLGMTPRGEYLGVIAGVLAGALVSFAIAALILRADKSEDYDLEAEMAHTQSRKAESKGGVVVAEGVAVDEIPTTQIDRVIFACDAGMGSSAMGASLLRKKFQAENVNIDVTNSAINQLKADNHTLVITQQELTPRARQTAPNATHVSVDNFLQSPKYDELVQRFTGNEATVDIPTATQQTTERVENIKNVVVVFDEQKRGTGTMITDTLEKAAKASESKLNISKVSVNDMVDQDGTVFVVPNELSDQVKATHVEVVDDVVNDAQLEGVIAKY